MSELIHVDLSPASPEDSSEPWVGNATEAAAEKTWPLLPHGLCGREPRLQWDAHAVTTFS